MQTAAFSLSRAGFMTGLGMLAALLGSGFQGVQQFLWALLGGLYILIGLVYISGGTSWLVRQMHGVISQLPPIAPATGGVALGVVFGLNLPACAAPLLAVLLGDTAVRSAGGAGVAYGGVSLLVFGLALSSPLVFAVFTQRGRRLLEAITRLAGQIPRWTGGVLIVFGLWSVALAL